MPTVAAQREHHERWRETTKKRVANQSHGRSAYEPDSHARVGGDVVRERAASAASGSDRRQARIGALSIMRSRAKIQPATQSSEDRQDKNRVRQWCSGALAP